MRPEQLLELSAESLPEQLSRAFGLQISVLHRLGRKLDGWAMDFDYSFGWKPEEQRVCREAMINAPHGFAYHDPLRPRAEQRNKAFTLRQLGARDTPARTLKAVFPKAGLAGLDQLRVLVCDGDQLGAWVGGFRERPFTAADCRRLERLVPSLKQWLAVDAWRRRAVASEGLFDSLLEKIAVCAVIGEGHQVQFATSCAKGVPARVDPDELSRAGWSVVPLERGANGRVRWLAQRPTLPASLSARLDGFEEVRALTRRQRVVLEALLLGKSNKELAELLACTESTVEAHATRVFRALSVSSRYELMARFLR